MKSLLKVKIILMKEIIDNDIVMKEKAEIMVESNL